MAAFFNPFSKICCKSFAFFASLFADAARGPCDTVPVTLPSDASQHLELTGE